MDFKPLHKMSSVSQKHILQNCPYFSHKNCLQLRRKAISEKSNIINILNKYPAMDRSNVTKLIKATNS